MIDSEPNKSKQALLVIAHGSRNAAANDELVQFANQMRTGSPYRIVEPAFLELAEPNIDQAAHQCVSAGAMIVVLLPYFLSAGVHVKQDLENYRQKLNNRYEETSFLLANPLGPHPLLLTIAEERAEQCLRQELS